MLTNKDGSDVGQFLYTPFGEMWVEEASTVDISHITRFFTNQQYDKESGLYYMNARYYDAHLGSFITPDPAMDGLNHYAYCNSNPVNYTDPTGLATVVWDSPDNCPGHYGDLQNDGGDTLDPWEAAYGNEGIGTGGPGYGDSGSSQSQSSESLHLSTLFDPVFRSFNNNLPIGFNFNPQNVPSPAGGNEYYPILEALSIAPNSVTCSLADSMQCITINANVNPGKAAFFGQEFLFPTITTTLKNGQILNIACFGTEIINAMSIKYTELTGKPLTDKLAQKMAAATIENGSILAIKGVVDSQKFMDAAWGLLANDKTWIIGQNCNGKLTGSWEGGSGPYHIGLGDRYGSSSGGGFLHWELILSNTRTIDSWIGGFNSNGSVNWYRDFNFGFVPGVK